MAETPLMDIIVPMYNLSGYIDKTLASLAKQTYKNYHVIMVDDGSTDDTLETAQRFAQDPHFELIALKRHQGTSVARNTGIQVASGYGLLFVDGDDIVEPDYVARLAEGLVKEHADIAIVGYTWYRSFNGFGSRLHRSHWQTVDKTEMLRDIQSRGDEIGGYIWNKAFRRDLIEKNDVTYDTRYQIGEDFLFTMEAAAISQRFVYYDQTLYYKISRPTSTIHSRTSRMWGQEENVFTRMAEIALNSMTKS